MRRAVSVGVRACGILSLGVWAAGVYAQPIDVTRGIGQVLRALQAPERGTSGVTSAQPQRLGPIDTPENLQAVVQGARERIHNSVSGGGADDACQAAANPLRPGRLQGSGWMELVAKCTTLLEQDQRTKDEAAAAQERRRAEAQTAQGAQARKESDAYEAQRQALLAGLKAGTVAPKNCAQWMVGRGLDRYQLQANDISRIGYRAPHGQGYFDAVIQQIQGENLLVRLDDHLAVITMDKNTPVFRDGEIVEQGRLGVVGEQSGTRTLKRRDGSNLTVALVKPFCVVGAPNHLLDLMPDGDR
jgi:hypothetical protein